MAYIIKGSKRAVVYCANYRVASEATSLLMLKMGARKIGLHHDDPRGKTPLNAIIAETVRHHCDVMCSWWYWRNTSLTFPYFVRLVLDGEHGALKPDAFYDKFESNYILKYENLDQDWHVLCQNAGLRLYQTIHRTPSKRPTDRTKETNWQNLMPPDLQHEVYDRYQDEFEKFGYGIYY